MKSPGPQNQTRGNASDAPPLADAKCPPAAQRKQAKRACNIMNLKNVLRHNSHSTTMLGSFEEYSVYHLN